MNVYCGIYTHCQIGNYTTAVIKQGPVSSNNGMMFFVWFMARYYKQDKLIELLSQLFWAVAVRRYLYQYNDQEFGLQKN
jgi:hypothetical protein